MPTGKANNPKGINQYTKGVRKGNWIDTRPEYGKTTGRMKIRATTWVSAVVRANKASAIRDARSAGKGNVAARKAAKNTGFGWRK